MLFYNAIDFDSHSLLKSMGYSDNQTIDNGEEMASESKSNTSLLLNSWLKKK